MAFGSQVKYSKLPAHEERSTAIDIGAAMDVPSDRLNYNSYFTYTNDTDNKFETVNSDFSSAFKYNSLGGRSSGHLSINVREDAKAAESNLALKFATHFISFMSYLFFFLTLPISYWFFVKKMGEFERLVVFRLGKLIGVKGPGRVVIFPWMDRIKKIDVRAAAFSVPPQQFITCDGGIIEIGAEIQYGIVDIVTMVSEVVDHQEILRSLSKSLLVKVLVKKTVRQIEKERKRPAAEIQDELNLQVRKWGMDVQKVELSEPKILKQAENTSNAAVGSILKGLGLSSGEKKYPTPQEFVRISHELEEGSSSQSASGSSSFFQLLGGKFAPEETANMPANCNWGSCLEVIMKEEFNGPIDEAACGLYKMEITGNGGPDIYFISISNESRTVKPGIGGVSPDGRQPDVTVTISSSDLASVLEGTLAPLQAYLSGRISAHGDVRKLMLFDKLSNRGRKPGSMFSV